MKQLKNDLKNVTKTLKSLTQKVEKIQKQIDKLDKPKTTRAKQTKKAPAKRIGAKKTTAKKTSAKKPVSRKGTTKTAYATVIGIINRSKKGVGAAKLVERTGFNQKKIANLLYKGKKQGKIKNVGRGIYVKA